MKNTSKLAAIALILLMVFTMIPGLQVSAKEPTLELRLPYWTGIGTGPSPESVGGVQSGSYGYFGFNRYLPIPGSVHCSPCTKPACPSCGPKPIYKPSPNTYGNFLFGQMQGCGSCGAAARLPFKVDLNPTPCTSCNTCNTCQLKPAFGLSLMSPFGQCSACAQKNFVRPSRGPVVGSPVYAVPYVSNIVTTQAIAGIPNP